MSKFKVGNNVRIKRPRFLIGTVFAIHDDNVYEVATLALSSYGSAGKDISYLYVVEDNLMPGVDNQESVSVHTRHVQEGGFWHSSFDDERKELGYE